MISISVVSQVDAIQASKQELQNKLKDMEEEKINVLASLRDLELARENDQQTFTQEKERLSAELKQEKVIKPWLLTW